ncbi:MAG: hypothetical protein E7523_02460 [Ruminococcaceae bacterium]|nr:hypothetical protein [Oscillospiraceae bacterium]
MKKVIAFILSLSVVLLLSACAADFAEPTEPTTESTSVKTEKTPAVVVAAETEKKYACEQCGGACTYYTGLFLCPAIDRDSEDAKNINAEIEAEYNKYLAYANAEDAGELSYGFTYSVSEDDNYAIIRTSVATVMLHAGGAYSHSVYYYDLEKDCKASVQDICRHLGLDVQVIAAYVRIVLAEDGNYSEAQIASVNENCIDIYPLKDTYYIKVINDLVKFETEMKGSDLNIRADAIASETATDEFVSEAPTIEQDVIYMDCD